MTDEEYQRFLQRIAERGAARMTPEEMESLRFKARVNQPQRPLPDSHTMPDPKYDTHKIDPSTDMIVGDIKHHFPPKGN
ncbi:hypothetical protein HOT49_gp286 [Erwinia phage vB_EamM_Alexandra]|uniref:Uncharacterized protein n=1 Tax=Erwinia phage vB_EamM_Alexandra TaxID=2201424 RepID=A0A2Z4QE52_9CAUD|nr:hypothetical protein HOT49_gp286 [Erwinia phage vB_EamM_Alexandra]AWY08545.1 hypothetical protein Alexandra_289 [Erwinia phage vB_EamM_Alexandra]